MHYRRFLSFVAYGVLSASLSAFAQQAAVGDQADVLSDYIAKIADRLYCAAEGTGGGKNGENYQRHIDEGVQEFKLLLQKNKAFINHKDRYGRTPLMTAAYYNLWEIIELLIKEGADRNLRCKEGYRALDYVKLGSSWGQPGSIKSIVRLVMYNYYTKERHNKCVEIIAKNFIDTLRYKQWVNFDAVRMSFYAAILGVG